MNEPRFIKLEPYSEEEWLETLADPDFQGSWLQGRYLEGLAEAKDMPRDRLEMNYARMKHRSESYADIIEELDQCAGDWSDKWRKDRINLFDRVMTAAKQRRTGADARHASTNKIKADIEKEWESWQDNELKFSNTNKFGDYIRKKYGFPADNSSIRKWDKKWRAERMARRRIEQNK